MRNIVAANANKRDGFNNVLGVEESDRLIRFFSEYPKILLNGQFDDFEKKILEKHHLSTEGFFYEGMRRIIKYSGFKPRRHFLDWFYTSQAVGLSAGRFARSKKSAVFSELYSAYSAFSNVDPEDCFLFQTHPYCPHLIKLYRLYKQIHDFKTHDSIMSNAFALNEELEMQSDWFVDRLTSPAQRAHKIICASQYVKSSLTDKGIANDRISVVPYGVDSQKFQYVHKSPPRPDNKIKLIFVGQPAERKGLNWFLRFWSEFQDKFELHLVGFDVASEIAEPFEERSVYCHGRLSPKKLIEMYQFADLLFLPSISEGYGLVLLQALACGTPILATKNSGAPDILNVADVGMTFAACDIDALRAALETISEDPAKLVRWSKEAKEVPELYTWAKFRTGISEVVSDY